MSDELPGTPPPTLQAVWDALSEPQRRAFKPHLLGGTGADWLARTMREHGFRLSATTIKNYRRSVREGVLV